MSCQEINAFIGSGQIHCMGLAAKDGYHMYQGHSNGNSNNGNNMKIASKFTKIKIKFPTIAKR